MALQPASQILEEMVAELTKVPGGPRERVIDEFSGAIKIGTGTGDSPQTRPIHDRADSVIQELRKSWGPTVDPHWVDKLVPGRESDGIEYDCLFALFHRKGEWGLRQNEGAG
jgi:hypothetical protein